MRSTTSTAIGAVVESSFNPSSSASIFAQVGEVAILRALSRRLLFAALIVTTVATLSNVPADGWDPLTVRVKNRNVDIRARAGYAR